MAKRRKNQSKRRSLQPLTLCISTAMVLVLVGMVVLSVLTAKNLSDFVKENFVITLTLDDDMTKPEAQQLTKSLKKKVYTHRLDFISKEKALKMLTKTMGADPTEFIGTNPAMASVELYLHSDYANSDSLRWIQKELKAYRQVSEITYQRDLMDSVNTNIRNTNIVLLVLAFLLTCISFTLINNTVRLGIYARRFNIHTMKLVGASWSFIRWPFIKQGIGVGILASLLANGVIAGSLYVLYTYNPDMLSIVTPEVMIITGVSVFAFGMFLTWMCTYISVNRFLKMKAGQLYAI